MNDNEWELLEILKNGHSAFTSLVERYKRVVFTICFKFVGDYQRAEDLTQETFCELAKSNPQKKDDFKAYLYQISRNTCIDYLRKQKKEIPPRTPDNNTNSHDPSVILPLEQLIEKESSAKLRSCLSRLPYEEQIMVILDSYGGWTLDEIANYFNLSGASAIFYRLKLAYKNLKDCLEKRD